MEGIGGFIQPALAASLLAKGAVEGVKMAIELPRWAKVLLAAVFAFLFEFILLVSQKAVWTSDTVATFVLIGVVAWLLSIGVTMAQTKADKVEERIETALQLPLGSTKSDVDAAVKAGGEREKVQ